MKLPSVRVSGCNVRVSGVSKNFHSGEAGIESRWREDLGAETGHKIFWNFDVKWCIFVNFSVLNCAVFLLTKNGISAAYRTEDTMT